MNTGLQTLRKIAKLTIIVLLVGLALFGCRKKSVAMERPPALVTASEAVARDVPTYIDEIGTCTACEVVSVHPQIAGQITEIHFTDGADLKKGDMLFTIDPRPNQAALVQAQASLAQSTASLALAKSEFERVKTLLPTGAISKEEYDIRQNAVAVGEAQVQASQAAIQTAQVNLDYCFIRSPIDGLAGQRQVDIGNVVTASNSNVPNSGTPLLVIQRLDPVYADFTITERDLASVRRQMAKDDLKTYVRLPDESDANAREGNLTFLDNAVQEGTGTVKLRATLRNQDHYFWPGQFVRVRLVLSTLKDAVLVPSEAIQISQNGPFVYVIRPDSTAELRLVKLGQQQGNLVVITDGLAAGEKVVTSGQLTVTSGGKVRLQEMTPKGGQQAQPSQTQGAKSKQ
ncbi:MAG: efflux RND transporter periplasmic adaptor subunit [Sedimentisphaerales bacterium]